MVLSFYFFEQVSTHLLCSREQSSPQSAFLENNIFFILCLFIDDVNT